MTAPKPRFRIEWIHEQTPLKTVIIGSMFIPMNESAEILKRIINPSKRGLILITEQVAKGQYLSRWEFA